MPLSNIVQRDPQLNSGGAPDSTCHEPAHVEPQVWMEPDARPKLVDGALHIWQVKLDRSEDELGAMAALLSTDERDRAARFHFTRDREHYIAGRGILRNILARYLDQPARELLFNYGLRGKPVLSGAPLQFNLAHSGGVAVIALSRDRSVGIDIEQIRVVPRWEGITNSFFSATEREAIQSVPSFDRLFAFFTCWTRKEAYLKATGDGIGVPLDSFDVSVIPDSLPRLLRVQDAPEETSRWHFHTLPLTSEHIGVAAHDGPIEAVQHYQW
jgi:4'-phosphopantetheinyl transferase